MPESEASNVQDLAWIGDGVLALFARQWILDNQPAGHKSELFKAMTCNQFLSSFGRPTEVEAEIGRIYLEKGLENAFAHIDRVLVPLFRKQLANRRKH